MSNYEAKLNAFFKFFEIPELENIDILQNKAADWDEDAKPPQVGSKKSNKLYYHSMHDLNEYIIIITMPRGGIDKYDLKTNTTSHLTDFPDNFECDSAETLINPTNGDLYIIGGRKKCFGIFNIESLKWDIKCLNEFDDSSRDYDLSAYGNDPKILGNDLYIKGWKCIRKYDVKKDKFIELEDDKIAPKFDHQTKLYYLPCINKYIQFGSITQDSSYIYSKSVLENQVWTFGDHKISDINDNENAAEADNGEKAEDEEEEKMSVNSWRLSSVGLPLIYDQMLLKHVISYDNIIVMMYFSTDVSRTEIWFLEVNQEDFDKSEYWKSTLNLRTIFPRFFMFFSEFDGKMHAINFEGVNDKTNSYWDTGGDYNVDDYLESPPFHLSIDFIDILPKKLKDKYGLRYMDLVNGFVREIVNDLRDGDGLSDVLPLIQLYLTVFK